ncbi:hypothetical protein Tco_1289053 [Tanacetum coccineum]
MPRTIVGDTSLTRSNILKYLKYPFFLPSLLNSTNPSKTIVFMRVELWINSITNPTTLSGFFTNICFNCLFEINEPIVPWFILDFYNQVTLQTSDTGHLLISFMIQHEFITLSLAKLGQILKVPYNGQAVFTNEWDLSSLAFFQETERPYYINLPTPDEIRQFLQLERIESNRTIISKNVILSLNQILTKELRQDMKRWEEPIRENQIVNARATPTANLPYGMFLTRLYLHVMEIYPHLDNGIYNVVDRVMRPLALKQTCKPRSDHGMQKSRHSVSSSSTHHFGSSSHHGDDDGDAGTSRASTPSPTSFLNSLSPLTHQTYNIPTSS